MPIVGGFVVQAYSELNVPSVRPGILAIACQQNSVCFYDCYDKTWDSKT